MASNSTGGNAILDPTQCASAAQTLCAKTLVNVGAYWALSYNNGNPSGWTTGYPGAYAVSVSAYSSISLGQGTNIGANDPTLVAKGNASMNLGIVGAGSNVSGPSLPLVQDTVTIQVAFRNPGFTTNLDSLIAPADIFFTYGTAPDAATGAPEPASIAIFAAGIVALGLVRRRRRHELTI